MASLSRKDCQENDIKKFETQNELQLLTRGCDKLNNAFRDNEIEIFNFQKHKIRLPEEKIIDYTLAEDFKTAYFTTSRYVGFYTTTISNESVSITINPRFGDTVRDYLFAHALGIYLPKGESGKEGSASKNLWLISLLWRGSAEKAITKSQIPKTYNKIEKNNPFFRGRLNVQKQIRHNSVDQSKFYCTYSQFSYDNTINQTLRYCYRLLSKEKEYRNILKGFSEHDEMLADFGVPNDPVLLQAINKIVYTPMTKYYKPLMELSKAIISFKSFQNSSSLVQKSGFSVFLDMAEVWENYLYNLLRKNLNDYEVENPNLTGDYPLFKDGSRKVRPDILLRKNGKVVAVVDAKYKYYTWIGGYAGISGAVSREDLYQMTTYLHRFGNTNTVGLFVAPFYAQEEPKIINGSQQRIGVMGLDIDVKVNINDQNIEDKEGCIKELLRREDCFIAKFRLLLDSFE